MTSPNTIIADLTAEVETLRKQRDELAYSMRDAFPVAHRLALELECLLLDTKDMAIVTKWWDSANEALEQWREFCREDAQC